MNTYQIDCTSLICAYLQYQAYNPQNHKTDSRQIELNLIYDFEHTTHKIITDGNR